jgi:hypothetical protein
MDLETASAFLAERAAADLIWEFPVTRPTPVPDECDLAATGVIVMRKLWDLSPVDPSSFDPTEPPGRPLAPPQPTTAPTIQALTDLVVGSTLISTTGTWTGSPTYTRQWRRNATNIGGGTGTSHVLVANDVGANITCNVTATNAAGGVTATSNALGPILDVPPLDPEGEGDGESAQPHRTTRQRRAT